MTGTHTLLASLLFLLPAPVLQGWLGVYLADREQPTVTEVIPDSPAAKAGIRAGDVLLAIDGTEIDSIEGLQQALGARAPGDRVQVKVRRKERTRTIEVVLGPRPPAVAVVQGTDRHGKKPAAPAPETRSIQDPVAGANKGKPYVGIAVAEEGGALVIDRVLDGGPGKAAGLQPGDRITHWNNRRIRDLKVLDRFLRDVHPGDKLALTVLRSDGTHSIVVTVSSAPGSTSPGATSRPTTRPATRPVPTDPVSQADPFGTDLAAAKKRAKDSGKRVLAVFGATWSSSSHAFRRSLLRQDLLSAMSRYECVWLDTDAHSDLADKLRVRGLPHVVIFDGDKVAFQRAGYLPPDLFLPLLEKHRVGGGRPPVRDTVVEQPVLQDTEIVETGDPALEKALERVQARLRELNSRLQRLQRSRDEEIRGLRKDLDALRKILGDLKKQAR